MIKAEFENQLRGLMLSLEKHVSTNDGQWAIKGFIDALQNIYTISSDTKVVSKILEIHLFPELLSFANKNNFKLIPAEHQNWYPDISLVHKDDEAIKFAIDFKTTYRIPNKPHLCNGFTLGSHGKYFEDRQSTKNIQFPYGSYSGHFCLGIIYDRIENSTIDETKKFNLCDLTSIESVLKNFQFFVVEKWKIASDKAGSGNTANIGSINRIEDLINGRGLFSNLGENWFDDYWMNYKKITITDDKGKTKKTSTLKEFIGYRKGDISLIVPKNNKP